MVRLSEAKKNKKYIIQSISGDSEKTAMFTRLGFTPGEVVELRRKAPLFGNPLLFQIEHAQYALTKAEASLVTAKEAEKQAE